MDNKIILLQLCTHAPSPDIRNCIRKYEAKFNFKQLRTSMNSCRVGELIAVLEYLKTPNLRTNLNDYKKEGLVMNLICRIENLLFDTCIYCDEAYCTEIDDPSLLPCEKCGQEPHLKCLLRKLGVTDADGLTQESVRMQLNPLELNSWTYICPDCKADYIPSKDLDVKKSATRKVSQPNNPTHAAAGSPTSSTATPSMTPTESLAAPAAEESPLAGDSPPPTEVSPTTEVPSPVVVSAPSSSQTGQLSAAATMEQCTITISDETRQSINNKHYPSTVTSKVCKDYLKLKCRFGKLGTQCRFEHPPVCANLLEHGIKTPYGCNGKECSEFHPTMCESSLLHQKCADPNCELFHMKGTLRGRRPAIKNANLPITLSGNQQKTANKNTTAGARSQNSKQQSNSGDFLDKVHLMKSKLLEVLDTRFTTL